MKSQTRWALRLLPFAFLTLCPGCGAGIVGLILGIDSLSDGQESGIATEAPHVVNLRVLENTPGSGRADDPRRVRVAFDLVDSTQSEDEVSLEVSTLADGNFASATLAETTPALAGSTSGTPQVLVWNAEADGVRGFRRVHLRVIPRDADGRGIEALLPGVPIGNDAPVVEEVEVVKPESAASVGQNVVVRFAIADTANDPVDIVLWISKDGGAEGSFERVPEAHILAGRLRRLLPGVGDLTWDSVATLGSAVVQGVVIGIVPTDGLHGGSGVMRVSSPPVRVDNNDAPQVKINAGDFLQNPDRRRGIPLPFEIHDPNGDEVRVVFQWRKPSEEFPELPDDGATLAEMLSDPAERRRLQVASERPRCFEGHVTLPVDGTDPEGSSVRLTEIAGRASPLLFGGVEGRELEILRPSMSPAPTGNRWDLVAPVAARPLADGLSALVLDRPRPRNWRLRELALGGGAAIRTIGAGEEGDPTALALDRNERTCFIAMDQAGAWRIVRLDLEGREAEMVFTAGAAPDAGPVRGLEALGSNAVLATVGDKLLRVDFPREGIARAGVLLSKLKTPWGIARDPLKSNHVYLSERDWPGPATAGRILSLEIDTRSVRPLLVTGPEIERPEGLAVESRGRRLLYLAARSDGFHDLRGLALSSGTNARSFSVLRGLAGRVGGIATGPKCLRLLALTSQDELAAGGGLAQTRTIVDYDPRGQVAKVDRPFEPALDGSERWRIADWLRPLRQTTTGGRDIFVWDTNDVPDGGEVLLRAVPFDSEVGTPDDTVLPKQIDGSFTRRAEALGSTQQTPTPQALAASDLDGDGFSDLAVASALGLTVYFQDGKQGFDEARHKTLIGVSGPRAVLAADLDGDGFTDLASAGYSGNHLGVFFETGPGDFGAEPKPLLLPGPRGPRALVAADLDGDGDLDLASANSLGGNVNGFLQRDLGSRVFETSTELTLGSAQLTPSPSALVSGDMDGDGDLDLAVASEGANAVVLFNQQASGVFEKTPVSLGGLPLVRLPQAVAAFDRNGDGLLDLAVASQALGTIAIFLQGAQGMRAEITPEIIGGLKGPRALLAEDLDGDGDLDLAAADPDGNSLKIFLQKPGSELPSAPDVTIGSLEVGERPLALAAADFDGDGLPDLAAASAGKNRIVVYSSRDSFTFPTTEDQVLLGATDERRTHSLSIGDLDGDGDLDLAGGHFLTDLTGEITANLQVSTGAYELEPSLSLATQYWTYSTGILHAVDVDGDGYLDLASAPNTPEIEVFFASQDRSFRQDRVLRLPTSSVGASLSVTDLDGDGRQDLVHAGTGITTYFQEQTGVFRSPPSVLPSLTAFEAIAAGDMDGDGDLDLVAAAPADRLVRIYHQAGPRVFSAVPDRLVEGLAKPICVQAVDLDADGDLDLVAGDLDIVIASFQEGQGGGFKTGPPFDFRPGGGLSQETLMVEDLDEDGLMEVIATDDSSSEVIAFFQGSPGTFTSRRKWKFSELGQPRVALISDLDGDGDLDLTLTKTATSEILVLYGNRCPQEGIPCASR